MKIGLFFGSFNPVHIGHMILAESILEQGYVEKVWFIVSPQNPFKEKKDLLDKEERLKMVNMAIDGDERMHASDIEFDMSVPSYTCDTIAKLKEMYVQTEFFLIVGMDAWTQMPMWKNFDYLKTIPTLVYPRPIQDQKLGGIAVRTTKGEQDTFIQAVNMPISSTLIRNNIAEGKSVKYFLNDAVYEHIKQKNLYQI